MKNRIEIDMPIDRQMSIATELSIRDCLEGLEEYLWDGRKSKEDIAEEARDIIEEVASRINKNGTFHWDLRHGLLWFDASSYYFSEDAITDFLKLGEAYMKKVIQKREKREMELADFLQEMIAFGWTPENFDLDFDRYQGDEVRPEEKETCRRILGYLWEDR